MKIRLIKNARVMDPANGRDAIGNISIDDSGQIAATAPDARAMKPEQIINAEGKWAIAGLVDLSARLREPGEEHKTDIQHESRAALAAGVTSVCIPPDTLPVIDTPAVVDLIAEKSSGSNSPRLYAIGAATVGLRGERLSEMAALKAAGCVAISNATAAIANNQMMRNIMDYAASHDLSVFLPTMEADLAHGGCVHEGAVATRLGLAGIPAASEVIAISRDLALIEATGVTAHFCRLSTARGVALIAEAQQRGATGHCRCLRPPTMAERGGPPWFQWQYAPAAAIARRCRPRCPPPGPSRRRD